MEVVEFLKNPRKFRELGAEIPRGVLLTGPSGTGKTLLAKAVAGEAGVPFFSISASEFIEMFVGVGASTSYDTKILIKTKDSTRLIPIGEFVNRFYKNNEEGFPIEVKDVWTLGADWARGTKFFKSSSWKKVKSVYRHKVDKIYEIYFTGGKIEVTGDHSIFIRNKNHIICKRADELRIGDILLGLPYKVRGLFVPGIGTTHKIRTHQFSKEPIKELIVWPLDGRVNNQIPLSISKALGWRYGGMRLKTNDLTKFLPYKIKVTPALMKLMGYYTAEGLSHKRSRSLRFCFGSHEKDLHRDCIKLMRKVFNLDEPKFFHNNNKDKSALVIYYNSLPIAQFFLKYCGNGAHNKHVPEFVWDLPKEYFVSYLEGLVKGDGYINKRGMIEFTSCSKQLISELRWLLNMHGIPCSVTKYTQLGGRIIKNSKTPLPKSTYWRITIAKSINPFSSGDSTDFSAKPTIKKIIKKPYNGYVYDLCGCENEAFFGGEKPILLHNSRVRSTFQKAKRNAPSIIYIDELDAIGRVRGAGIGGGHDEREQTLNQILVEMDGFETDEKVIIMSSTNRPDILDPALLRPGRFDRKIVLDLPDVKEREEILKIHTRGKPLESNVNLERIAKITAGFSGADLRNLANEAAILAARRNKKKISQNELEESIEKVLLGPERKSHLLSEKEKKITAYHETGHALLSHLLPNCDPVHKISIISRGPAAGYTWSLPTEDKKLHSKAEFEDNLVALLGGRTAEEISFGDITTGAQNDLKRATKIAKDMVTQYGMTEKLGPITWGEREELVFLGKELGEQKTYSEETASKIDLEVKNIIEKASKKAKQILSKNKSQLKKVAEKLIKEETLEGAELEKLFPRKQKA
jgi:ATP-dependent metalloprotease FtsH